MPTKDGWPLARSAGQCRCRGETTQSPGGAAYSSSIIQGGKRCQVEGCSPPKAEEAGLERPRGKVWHGQGRPPASWWFIQALDCSCDSVSHLGEQMVIR